MSARTGAAAWLPSVRTSPAPPLGRALFRFATVSDMHVGERHMGPSDVSRDPTTATGSAGSLSGPLRSSRHRRGPGLGGGALVVKGDLTYAARPAEASTVADALASARVPVQAILGNHDVDGRADVAAVLGERGILAHRDAYSMDVPGVRLLFGHTPVPGLHGGRLVEAHARDLAQLAGGAAGPVVLVVHHPPRRLPGADLLSAVDLLAGLEPAAGRSHTSGIRPPSCWPGTPTETACTAVAG